MRFLLATTIIVLTTVAFAGCLEGKAESPDAVAKRKAAEKAAIEVPVPKPKSMYVVATDVATPLSEGVFKMRTTGGSTTFNAKKDEAINLTLKNAVGNQYIHNLVLDGYGHRLKGVKDSTVSVEFNATKAGSYKFYCDLVFQGPITHRQLGMEGTFIVS